jgi:putative aldouronate transport system permease protein
MRPPTVPWLRRLDQSKYLLILFLPCLLKFLLFNYYPMWGILVAFEDFKIFSGFAASPWVGLKYFRIYFSNPDAFILIRNTFLLGCYRLALGFPAPILFALLLNEVRNVLAKRAVQTISYLPHFISTVVLCGMVVGFLSPRTGLINALISALGGQPISFLTEPRWFRTIYTVSGVWQNMGWNAIVYIAAISTIDPQLYEAAIMDGANKAHQIWHVTLPSIAPAIATLFILETGSVLSVGFEKVFLLYNPAIYSVADVVETYVYRVGIRDANFSYATAIGLSLSAVSLVFVWVSNALSRRFSETSLW